MGAGPRRGRGRLRAAGHRKGPASGHRHVTTRQRDGAPWARDRHHPAADAPGRHRDEPLPPSVSWCGVMRRTLRFIAGSPVRPRARRCPGLPAAGLMTSPQHKPPLGTAVGGW